MGPLQFVCDPPFTILYNNITAAIQILVAFTVSSKIFSFEHLTSKIIPTFLLSSQDILIEWNSG